MDVTKKEKKKKKQFSTEVGKVHAEQKKHLTIGSRFTTLEADGRQGDNPKDATNTN